MQPAECSLCDKPVHARGWCWTHYLRWRKNGDPLIRSQPKILTERCTICRSLLRPYNSRKRDWPGTKGKASTNPLRCTAHQHGKKSGGHDFREDKEVARPDKNAARIVRRRIQERFEGDDYLLITEALGIGDDID